jgi:hypothetical protein
MTLTHEQTQKLLAFFTANLAALRTVKTTDSAMRAQLDSLVSDSAEWRKTVMYALDRPAQNRGAES